MVCQVMMYEGTPLSIEIAPTVKLTLVEADPVVRGQTASSSYKPGRLENGRRVMIPPYIEAGTRIVVNTADGSFVIRAKDWGRAQGDPGPYVGFSAIDVDRAY